MKKDRSIYKYLLIFFIIVSIIQIYRCNNRNEKTIIKNKAYKNVKKYFNRSSKQKQK